MHKGFQNLHAPKLRGKAKSIVVWCIMHKSHHLKLHQMDYKNGMKAPGNALFLSNLQKVLTYVNLDKRECFLHVSIAHTVSYVARPCYTTWLPHKWLKRA